MSEETVVYLEDIAGKLDEVGEEWRMFLHRKTGVFTSFQNEHLGAAEDMESDDGLVRYAEWERGEIRNAMAVLSHRDEYVELPRQYDIHEYRIMEDFADTTPDPHKREMLLCALRGKGAFRRFKDTVIRASLEKEWYAYRYIASRQIVSIARQWCEDNDIAYRLKK